MFENKSLRIFLIIFVAVGLWGYFSGLTIDVTRDAGKYATAAKEIYQHGNYINLTVHGDPYDQKPPMLFWLGAAGFSIGGVSNFWFKFPVLLLVFLGFYWAYQLGKSLYNKRVGYITAILLFFSFIYSLYSMDIHTDTPLQAFVILAFWQLFEFIKTKKNKHWLLGFTAIGLAMLSKGPIGAAIPGFAVIGHLLMKKDFKAFTDYRWYLGLLLSFIVASPALIGLMNQFGWAGIRFFFWDNNVGRITGSYVKAVNDPLFYVHNLLYLFLPWSLLFFISAFYEFKYLIKNKFKSHEYFTLFGIWIYFIILNSASSQLPNYIFAIIPLIAVLTAKWTDIAIEQSPSLFRIFNTTQKVVVFIIWLGIFVVSFYLFPRPNWHIMLLIIASLGTGYYISTRVKDDAARLLLPSVIVFACLTVLLNAHVFPYIFSFQAPPKAARYFNAYAGKNDHLYNYKYGQYELYFYSEPEATALTSDKEMEAVAGKKGTWIFTDAAGYAEINKLNLVPDMVLEYKHLYLNRGGRFINPRTRASVLQPMYLIKY